MSHITLDQIIYFIIKFALQPTNNQNIIFRYATFYFIFIKNTIYSRLEKSINKKSDSSTTLQILDLEVFIFIHFSICVFLIFYFLIKQNNIFPLLEGPIDMKSDSWTTIQIISVDHDFDFDNSSINLMSLKWTLIMYSFNLIFLKFHENSRTRLLRLLELILRQQVQRL